MKLLFDQNLSHRLCRLLADVSPQAAQVRAAGLDQASDDQIWNFALREGFAIVTLDADFADMAALRGARRRSFGCAAATSRHVLSSACCEIMRCWFADFWKATTPLAWKFIELR